MGSNKNWIQSASGKKIDLLEPDPDVIDIEDIAHALSNLCRYTGHTARHYSVAEHSVRVSKRAEALAKADCFRVHPTEDCLKSYPWVVARWGLLHDASEAYLGDISRPLKYLPGVMEAYRALESKWMKAIAAKFSLVGSQPPEVSQADDEMLGTEAFHLMQPIHPEWGTTCPTGKLPDPLPLAAEWDRIGWDAVQAKAEFLSLFRRLFG